MEPKMEPMKEFLARLGDTAGWYKYAVRRERFHITPIVKRDIDLDNVDQSLLKAAYAVEEDMGVTIVSQGEPDLPALDWMTLDQFAAWVEANANFAYRPNASRAMLGMPYGYAGVFFGTPSPDSTPPADDTPLEFLRLPQGLPSDRPVRPPADNSPGHRETRRVMKRFFAILGESARDYQYAVIGRLLHVMPLEQKEFGDANGQAPPPMEEAMWDVIDEIAVIGCDYYPPDLAKYNWLKADDFMEWVEAHPNFPYDHNTTEPPVPINADGWAGAFLDTPSSTADSSGVSANLSPSGSPASRPR